MFVKIGKRAINLDNVAQIVKMQDTDKRPYITVDMLTGKSYHVYQEMQAEDYNALEAFIDSQTPIAEIVKY